MANLLGIVLFALGIGLTVALHEAGHMLTARAFGMRVRRYFIGFGPRLFSFRKGHTEYGLAAFPVGGFCDIAGMTAQDEFLTDCLLYTSPSPRDKRQSRMPSSA